MTVKKVFKSYIPNNNYVTPLGRTCVFREGRYETNHPEEVACLTREIKEGTVPNLYIDPEDQEIDTTLQDKMRKAAQDAALAVLAEHNSNKNGEAEENKKSQGQANTASNAGQVMTQGVSMTPATLLGVTNSASLVKGMAAPSNQK